MSTVNSECQSSCNSQRRNGILFTSIEKSRVSFFQRPSSVQLCNASYNDFWESFMTWINLKIGFQVASVLWLGSSNFGVSCFFLLLGSSASASLLGESDIEVSFGLCFGDNFQPFFSPQAKDGMFARNSEEIQANKFFPRRPGSKGTTGESNKANVANICRCFISSLVVVKMQHIH